MIAEQKQLGITVLFTYLLLMYTCNFVCLSWQLLPGLFCELCKESIKRKKDKEHWFNNKLEARNWRSNCIVK